MKLVIKYACFILFFLGNFKIYAQSEGSKPYYYEIPPYPDSFSAANVAARLIDGVGFRYYWATDGLREKDLAFRPNDEARTSLETLQHIYGLSLNIVRATQMIPNEGGGNASQLSYEELRNGTLENLRTASEILKSSSDDDLKNYKIIFKGRNGSSELPFWNLLNGQIADALWHIGQVVSFRRSSGNPFDSRVNVLIGKKGE